MIKEAIESLFSMGQESTKVVVNRLPDRRSVVVLPGGKTEFIEAQEPDRAHIATDVDSFVEAVNAFEGYEPTVWVGPEVVTAILDCKAERRHSVSLPLTFSDQFLALSSLPKTFDQRELRMFLKSNFAMDAVLLRGIKKIDFSRQGSGQSSVEHGRETLGRSVEAHVQGAEELPETDVMSIPVYSNRMLRAPYSVELRLDIDVERQTFTVLTGPNELAILLQSGVMNVLEYLRERLNTNRVFLGNN